MQYFSEANASCLYTASSVCNLSSKPAKKEQVWSKIYVHATSCVFYISDTKAWIIKLLDVVFEVLSLL